MRITHFVFFLFLTVLPYPILGQPQNKTLLTANAMVVSAHPEASRIGKDILKKGGNAFDAAVAVQFALAVCYPTAGNIGGGGFAVYRKNTGEVGSLDYREKAPLLAHRDMYLGEDGNAISSLSRDGHLAVGVPGAVDGMVQLHQRHGKLSWAELLQPAIDLARSGVILTEREAQGLNKSQKGFSELNYFKPVFVKDKDWQKGELLIQKNLAKTLERIRDYGRDGFYAGETAYLLVKEMKRGKGLISLKDLENYQAIWRRPIVTHYKDHKIITMGPPSSGGIVLSQILKMIEGYELKKLGWHSEKYIQLLVEAERRAYADRAEYMGDSDFYPVPIDNLVDEAYLKGRMKDFSFERAGNSEKLNAGVIGKESEETTHFSIVDPEGNAVSITTTLNGSYGSKVVVEGAGFILNNEMDDFSAQPGVPNLYGLIGGEANSIVPSKRMLSSMTPTIVEKDAELFMVLGTPGGSTIITSVLQNILNVVEFGMDMQSSVASPRFHHQWLPDIIFAEEGVFTEKVTKALEEKGYKLYEGRVIGRVDAIRLRADGKLEGGADPRGDDSAKGF